MNWDGFLGNDALRQRLSQSFAADRISHCYLISGPEGSGKHTLAAIMAAAMQCTGSGEKPCRCCTACRKVFSGQHPDVITVDDTEHKNVAVDVIRDARADVFVRPNEGRRKVYVIPRGQDLGAASQNALLKILEEPPQYAVFLLLTTNAEQLLPTIRSRSAQLSLCALTEREAMPYLTRKFPEKSAEQCRAAMIASGGFLGQTVSHLEGSVLLPQTAAFAQAYAAQDRLALLRVLIPLEKLKRQPLCDILQQLRLLLSQALGVKAGLPAVSENAAAIASRRTAAQLLAAAQSVEQAVQALDGNAAVGAVIGWLCTRLR